MKKSRIIAAFCAIAMCFSLTACADTTWAMKCDDITIPTGVYNYYLLQSASYVSQQGSSSSSSTSSTDIWSQTVSGTNAVTWAINTASDEVKNLITIESLAKTRNITLTDEIKSSAESTASSNYSSYGDMFKNNDIAQTSLERIVQGMYLKKLLFDSYYGADGDKKVSDAEISSYYTENFVNVKQIFVAKFDVSTYQALTDDKLTEAKAKAEKAFAEAKASPDKFDDLVKTYNEDPGMTATPTGYVISKKSAANQNFDTKFTDLAFSLKDGEVGMAESDMGWFIEQKVKIDPTNTKIYTDTQKATVLSEMKADEFEDVLKEELGKLNIETNTKALDKYSPKNLKLN